jgi:hypothetical protein
MTPFHVGKQLGDSDERAQLGKMISLHRRDTLPRIDVGCPVTVTPGWF